MSITFRCPKCEGQLISMNREPVKCKCSAGLKNPPSTKPARKAPARRRK